MAKVMKSAIIPIILWLSLLPPSQAATAVPYMQLAGLKSAPTKDLYQLEPQPLPEQPSAPNEPHISRRAIDFVDYYDPDNPDRNTLQRHDEVTRNLPQDAVGFPDWMRSLREGKINPRASLNGKDSMDVLDLDIILRNTKEMPNVRFPHSSHTMWLACSNCHPKPFIPKAGANQIRMADIFRGQFCGMCHDRVAFITFFSCMRCHSVPKDSAPPKQDVPKEKPASR
jgi:c(7)-type cytochrome triheme protein